MEAGSRSDTILVVEDEQRVADLTKDILLRFGYSVLVVNSGEQAIDLYQQRSRDIAAVVLDMVMPEMDGSEVFRRLQSINPQVKVIIATGVDIDPVADKMLQQGATGFIQKPYRIAELVKAVAVAVKGE